MAENVIRIEGITPISGLMPVVETAPTGVSDAYGYSMHDIPGVVAANTFLSVFNPLGSGKNLYLVQVVVSRFAIGSSTGAVSLEISRTSAASGGVLQPASEIVKANTSDPDTVAEVRTGNPTTTIVAEVIAFSPPLGGNWSTTADVVTGSPTTPFSLQPGEGIAYRTQSGDTNQRWNITQYWVDVDI